MQKNLFSSPLNNFLKMKKIKYSHKFDNKIWYLNLNSPIWY